MNDTSPVQPTLLRLKHIIGDKNTPPIIPLSKSALVVWRFNKAKYPHSYQDRLLTPLYGAQMTFQELVDRMCFR